MDAVTEIHPGYGELVLTGEFDFTQEELARDGWLLVMRSAPQRVLLDVSGLTFLDSTAVRFLLWCTREAAGRGASLALVTGANERLHRLLRTLGWEQLMPLYPTRATAIAALAEDRLKCAGAEAGATSFCDGCPLPKETQRLASLLEYTSDAVFSVDRSGLLADVNGAAAALSGYSRAELIGMHWSELLPPGERKEPLEGLRQALDGVPHRAETVILHRDGRRLELDITTVPVRVDEEIAGVFGVARDVTRRNQAERRVSMLVEAGRRLTGAQDLRGAVASLGEIALPLLGDYAVVDLAQPDGSLRPLSASHADRRREALVRELLRSSLPAEMARQVMAGRVILQQAPSELLRGGAPRDAEHRRALRRLRPQALICVPLAARGRVLGALTLARTSRGSTYSEEELAIAEELARNAGLCLDNARLYEMQSEIAHTLQRSLLPAQLPQIPGVEVACCYHAAGELNQVGGDFYDLFPAAGGSWVALIGDVVGKGPAAAAVTAVVRHTVRAAAHLTHWPRRMLELANTAVLQEPGGDAFCTALCVRLTPRPQGLLARGTSAGHLPPLVLRAGGKVEVLECPGLLVGLQPEPELSEWTVDLGPGDTLVLYTDGVTEARLEGRLFGEERLHDLLSGCGALPAAEVVARVERAVLEFQKHSPADDIAVLALRIQPELSAPPSPHGRWKARQPGAKPSAVPSQPPLPSGAPSCAADPFRRSVRVPAP